MKSDIGVKLIIVSCCCVHKYSNDFMLPYLYSVSSLSWFECEAEQSGK